MIKLDHCLALLTVAILSFQNCGGIETSGNTENLPINSEIKSVLAHFIETLDTRDSSSVFVFIRNVDALTSKVYIIAKQPQRSDFEFIGLPFKASKWKGRHVYFYAGIEKLLVQDTSFWLQHPEIMDDRESQNQGVFEFPVVKKESYQFHDGHLQLLPDFDDWIFIVNPTRDTIGLK
ncbi:MAG: hypothetical protein R3A50_11945 [Saprospiraceae bacterium]